jgi:3-hydroxyisobutyrate dehydrogenase-like beta-hydroxyacid dehydrogenase
VGAGHKGRRYLELFPARLFLHKPGALQGFCGRKLRSSDRCNRAADSAWYPDGTGRKTMAETDRGVGFIGLGRMGAGIARNIMKAGYRLTVYNRTAAKMQPLLDAGAAGAASPAEAAANADVVVTSLMDDQSVLDAVEGGDGVLRGLRPGAVHVGATTVSPGCARTLAAMHAAHGSDYVAAPVLGRPDVADAGQLTSLVAGDAGAIARCHAVISAYSRAVMPVSVTPAVANSLKLAVNYLLFATVDLMGQAFAFGEKSGIEPQHLDMVMQTMFSHPGLQGYAARMRERRFDDVGFDLLSGLKDVQLVLDASTEARAPLPFANVIRDKTLTGLARGLGAKDVSVLYEITRINAGLD